MSERSEGEPEETEPTSGTGASSGSGPAEASQPDDPSGGQSGPAAFRLEDYRTGYLAEVEDQLAVASEALVVLESGLREDRAEPRAVRSMLRAVHTIKGLSAMVDIEPLVELAHAMEESLRALDQAGAMPSLEATELLQRGLRQVEQRTEAVAARKPVEPAPIHLLASLVDLGAVGAGPQEGEIGLPPEVLARLDASERRQLLEAASAGRHAYRIEVHPSPERAAAGLNITGVRRRIAERGDLVKVLPLSRSIPNQAAGGLVFLLLVVSAEPVAALAEAAGVEPADVVRIPVGAPPQPRVRPTTRPTTGPTTGPTTEGTPAPRGAPAEARDPAPPPLQPEHWEPAGAGEAAPAPGPDRGGVVRVDVRRLDDALDKLSALVVTRFKLERTASELDARGVDVRDLRAILAENARQLRDLRSAVMRTRLVSVADLLGRIPLILRGLRRATGKEVRLELEAGRAELDKAVAERLFPAIVHLVRNAVDHGMEPADERLEAGKPEAGRLRVACHERGDSQLELTVEDDGRGIDAEALARRAAASGAEVRVPRTDTELLDLLSVPGLSTRAAATETSGRGMGMDIVRSIVVERLNGELVLRTTPGQGSAFTLRVPLNLAIVDAISFMAGGQTFLVPVSSVEQILELEPSRVVAAPSPRGRGARLLELRDEAVPLLDLARLLELSAVIDVAPRGDGADQVRAKALVTRRGEQRYAFVVERLLGQQEVVVRPLEDPLVRVAGVAGATDLGDGQPTLVLDLVALAGQIERGEREAA